MSNKRLPDVYIAPWKPSIRHRRLLNLSTSTNSIMFSFQVSQMVFLQTSPEPEAEPLHEHDSNCRRSCIQKSVCISARQIRNSIKVSGNKDPRELSHRPYIYFIESTEEIRILN